jgi:adenine phosphoribosyltransferase
MQRIKAKIRDIADFPNEGVSFKDITPLLKDPDLLNFAVDALIQPFRHSDVSLVIGMEARGFIFGSLAATALGVGFVPLRKPGKLPHEVETIDYDLEYGSARLEIHSDALQTHDRILIIDDVLATGGTAKASCELVEKLGGKVVACAFVIELNELQGRQKLNDYSIHSLVKY